MAGESTDQKKLNRTLEKACSILSENNFNDWFIFFGTLLGIVRENSCIQGDDDLDIMINCDYEKLRSAFEEQGFVFTSNFGIKNPDTILKTEPCDNYGSIDFYICNVNEFGDFYTPWHRVKSTKSKPFITKEWRSTILNLPNDYLQKIVSMYGKDWEIPQSNSCKMGIDV